jgi:hypothetical protein
LAAPSSILQIILRLTTLFFYLIVILERNNMTIYDLITNIKSLALSHDQVSAVHVGNTFDIATSKSTEKYPAIWIELPILSDYIDRRKKTHTFALNALSLSLEDDIEDQIYKTSDMEVLMDEILQAIDDKYKVIGISDLTSISLRNFSDDDLVGVRCDITFTIGRECDYEDSFNTEI